MNFARFSRLQLVLPSIAFLSTAVDFLFTVHAFPEQPKSTMPDKLTMEALYQGLACMSISRFQRPERLKLSVDHAGEGTPRRTIVNLLGARRSSR
jgi:hypothetical protein